MKNALRLSALLLCAATARAADSPDGFYRFPSIAAGTIVFASEGDIWKVPASGGTATRLTAYEGDEKFPHISPDGKLVAFTAQYEGNDDVYVMSSDGGEPKRLTYHPAPDQAIGWTSDGKILFRSRRDHPHSDFRTYTISPSGGIATMIPLEPAAWVSFEPGGHRMALQKMALEFHNWKRYKGGEAEKIYVGTLEPLAFTDVSKYDGKNAFPMWASDGRIYFVTDRWGRPNLASMKPDGSDVRRLTTFTDFDVRWPAMGDGKIVYQHRAELWTYDLATGKNEMVPIRLPSDRLQVRERFVDPKEYLGAWGVSRDGDRIALDARGDVFVARTRKKGLIRQITASSAARTKDPVFSPDGKWIAAWTEIDGDEQLVLLSADNGSPTRQLGRTEPGWHYGPVFSPDGKKLAWSDEKLRLMVAGVAAGAQSVADTAGGEITQYVWSPDSRYLAYSAPLANEFNQLRIWDSQTRTVHPASDPMINSFAPAWDPKGKYLYFLSDRFVNPYLDRWEARFIVNSATLPVVLALRADGELPFAPRGDTDPASEKKDQANKDEKKKADDEKKAKAGEEKAEKAEKPEKVEPIRIDFDGLADRLVQVPVTPGNYDSLNAVAGKLFWISYENKGLMPPGDEPEEKRNGLLQTYDIEKEKLSTLSPGVLAYDVSGNGKILVFQTKEGFARIEATATSLPKPDPGDPDETKVDLAGWTIRVNPRDEWKQMLHEAWRLQRDFFYDPNMHGVDWNAVWAQYGPLADRMASRDDLEDLLGEILGELNVGHAYHFPGDLRRGKTVPTGLLAADLDYDPANGFWKIKKIYRGDYPMENWSSPLARADLRVKPGQWLVAIDGKPLVKDEDYLKRLAGRANQEVELSINDTPTLAGARRVVVKTVSNDTRIRYADWIRETREYVDRASNGQIGYIHLYDMGGLGLRQFARDYPPQWNKRGLIMDDRWNHGGFVAPMILAHLDRKTFAVGSARHGALSTTPDRAFQGHMICLINRQGGSDCETFALGFKEYGLGPVVGTRTWGGWVGIRGDKNFRDGGVTTQPEFGGWDSQGKAWRIEGHGVDPDVELDLPPDGLLHGHDAQIDYAVQELLKEIAKDPRDLKPAPKIEPRPLKPVEAVPGATR
jgi:tricorn protease